jgi:gas vesicle protein
MRSEWTWGFLAGVGVGVGLGLVFAHQSGKETRDFIGEKVQEGLDQIASAGKKVGAQVKNATAKGKEQVSEALEAGKEAYREQAVGGKQG